ncbi:TPA: tRNA (N(6)-L-threonylcarbamoyladenosine(37)-C(2))-methylthiotransferase, partial [Candidatus Bathyarchaeota archaeon]|nr:tRNA (N(6)-L-threonylcarbamoyladenosine(37)-C(2))-methylthiotransferase [Candidatus Bathyarchaeota archaeon]
AEGYRLSNDPEKTDIILINTCGVKKPTGDRIIERIRHLSQLNRPLIICGCLPRINPKAIQKAAPNFAAMLDPRSVDRIVKAARFAQNGGRNIFFFSEVPPPKLSQPMLRLSRVIEIIAISEGCLGSCAYCCVRFARGRLHSFPKDDILEKVKKAVSEGIKEIWLTSQDSGAYGRDIGTNPAELLNECSEISGRFMIRVGMMNPNHALGILPELVESFKSKKIFNFLHLPVQSGDNEVLKKMNRRYTVEEFKKTVEAFRKEIPNLTLSTDIICGFPGEDSMAFENTISLIKEVKPDIVNVSKFFPRPGTPAEKMKQLDVKLIKDRSRRLSEIVRSISLEGNKRWLGWEGEILVDEKGKDSSWIGRNMAYKPIVVKSKENLIGRFLKVKVTKAFSTYLEADIVND